MPLNNSIKKYFLLLLIATVIIGCSIDDGLTDENGEQIVPIKRFSGDMMLRSQEEVNNFGEMRYNIINGDLFISGSDISDLTPLFNLTFLGRNLTVSDNQELESLQGLNNITNINLNVLISNNPKLASVAGLGQIKMIKGQINISDNDSLESLFGLNNIEAIDFDLIVSNRNLKSIEDLTSLVTIGRSLVLENNDIQSLKGLENLSSATMYSITRNASLVNYCDLQSALENSSISFFELNNNAFNPIVQDIIDGNCSQ